MMNTQEDNISGVITLLESTRLILSHQRKIEELRGEKFNVFSILRMESKENATHSAFLGELLNPKGSHLQGDIFLRHFMNVIGLNEFDTSRAKLKLEKWIGKRDDEMKTGGRVDIFISSNKQIVSIENKINARDQNAQIERYCNYNELEKEHHVYYLTLDGKVASQVGASNLKVGTAYHLLSYKEDIIHWLDLCLKEAADLPVLRESIKQYRSLIKKLTYTMDKDSEQKLINAMLKNYQASDYIAGNFVRARRSIGHELQKIVFDKLIQTFDKGDFVVALGNTDHMYMQIWITPKVDEEKKYCFGIESFSGEGHGNGLLFIGIHDKNGAPGKKVFGDQINNWWPHHQRLTMENDDIFLSNSEVLTKLNNNPEYKNKLADSIVNQSVEFISNNEAYLKK
ncbi:MAG: PD-(D/E)XK nuclease family protein [Cyclobacteriaceae bacterium]